MSEKKPVFIPQLESESKLKKLIEKTREQIGAARARRSKSVQSYELIEEEAPTVIQIASLARQLTERPTAMPPLEPARDEIRQPTGPLPKEYRHTDVHTLNFVDWIVRTGKYKTTDENFLINLWNWQFDPKAKPPDKEKLAGYFRSMSAFLTRFGLNVKSSLPSSFPVPPDAEIISDELGKGLKLPRETERLGIFPEGIPPIEQMWNKAQIKETIDIDNKHHFFLVLDVDFKDWWQKQTSPVGEIMQLYLENETKFAGNLKISLGIHLKGVSNRNEVMRKYNLQLSPDKLDALTNQGLTREELIAHNLFSDAGPIQGDNYLNHVFDVKTRVALAPRFKEMFHGWTGKRDTVKTDQIFNQAAACDEFVSDNEFDATLLLLMSGLGNEQTHSELLPDEFLNPNGDFSTHPKHYAKEMMTLIDMMGFWNKKIIESGHSMGGAAKYWFVNYMLERAEKFGVDKIPQLIAWAENPALRGVNIFLEGFNGMFIKTGMLTNLITEKIANYAALQNYNLDAAEREKIYDTITNDIVGRLMTPIAGIFTTLRLVPEETAEATALIHALVFSMISESVAVRQQTFGLLNQEDFTSKMIARLNSRQVFLGAVTGEDDKLCKASRPRDGDKCGQREKFDEYQLTHSVISFRKGGHFSHAWEEYQEIFCRFILPFAGVLNPAEMNQLFDSLKLIAPISERPRWLDLVKPTGDTTVNRIQYWKYSPEQRNREIEERLVPFWPEAIKNDERLKTRAMEFVAAVQDKIYFPAISEKDVLFLAQAENILEMKQVNGKWVFVRDDVGMLANAINSGGSSTASQKITDEILGELFDHPEQVNVWRQGEKK